MTAPPPKLVLCIETSNPSAAASRTGLEGGPGFRPGVGSVPCHVCVAEAAGAGARILGRGFLRPELRHDDDLVPAIDRAMREAGRAPRELGLVAVSVGPGGFTGLRVAMSAAVMIAQAANARVLPVATSRVAAAGWRQGAAPLADDGVLMVLLASKHDRTHASLVHVGGAMAIAETLGMVDAAELGDFIDRARGGRARVTPGGEIVGIVGDGFVPEPIRSACGARGFGVAPPRLDAEGVLAIACAEAARANDWVAVGGDPSLARVIYAREPEAVTKWRALHPRGG